MVSRGGSSTLNEIGLIDSLKKGKYNILDPNAPQGGSEKKIVAQQLGTGWPRLFGVI